MHIKKISIMTMAALMGVIVGISTSFAAENIKDDYKDILNERLETQKEEKPNDEGEELKYMNKDNILVLPESKEERSKLMVKEEEELAKEDLTQRAVLKKPEFRRIITTKDQVISGVASENTNIMLTLAFTDGGKETFKLKSDEDGFFGIQVPKGSLFEGMKISAYAYSGKTKSEVASTTVVRGVAVAPEILEVTTYTDTILGLTDNIHDNAYAEINGKVYECGSVDNEGYFYINIPRQKAGTIINVYTVTPDGIKSPVTSTIVQPGYTITNISKVSTSTKEITGKTRPYALVQVSTGNDYYIGEADKNGEFKVRIHEKLQRGKKVALIAYDMNSELYSEEIFCRVYATPAAPKVTNKRVTVNTTKITGTARAGFTAYVKAGNKYYKSTVDKDGKFSVAIPKQKKGTAVYVYIKGTNGVNSKKVAFKVASSTTAPLEPTVSTAISTNTTVVRGKGQSGTTATVRIGNKYYRSTVDKNGNFSIKIPAQKKGTTVKVYLKNKKGEYSSIVNKKVLQAPRSPRDLSLTVDGDELLLEGYTGKNTKVYVKVGSKTYTSDPITDDFEYFYIFLPKFKEGTTMKIYSKNINTGATSKVINKTVKYK